MEAPRHSGCRIACKTVQEDFWKLPDIVVAALLARQFRRSKMGTAPQPLMSRLGRNMQVYGLWSHSSHASMFDSMLSAEETLF